MSNQKPIRILIIDDEADARNALETQSLRIDNIEIIGSVVNAFEGLEKMLELEPDLAFVDIRMPRKTGLDLAQEAIKLGLSTDIVFLTAYNTYAIKAFKVAAFDYLLKPIDYDHLVDTLNRYKAKRIESNIQDKLQKLAGFLNISRLRLNNRTGFVQLNKMRIVWIEADGNYSSIQIDDGRTEIVTVQIGKIYDLLENEIFVRISRSVIVNKNYISGFNRTTKQLSLNFKEKDFLFKVSRDMLKNLT